MEKMFARETVEVALIEYEGGDRLIVPLIGSIRSSAIARGRYHC
jgi:hypothetical protein